MRALIFVSFILLFGESAQAHDVGYAITANVLSTETSKSRCVAVAHEVCEEIFRQCIKNEEAAVGGDVGYLVMYQCHDVKMDVNRITSLVIAGSRTENTSSEKLSNWVNRSLDLAYDRMR